MIETEGLSKRFGDVVAVDDLTLKVERGEVFGFLGPNGAGKTTTVRMLSCLIGKTGGRAVVSGLEVGRKEAPEIRRKIGVLPENAGLYEDVSAYRNLDYYGKLFGCSDAETKEAIERLLKMLDLWEKRDARAGTLSKGMKQKLSLARALVHDPEVLFLDEPTANLDPESSKSVRDFIIDLKKEKKTVFMNTHHLDEVEKTCDRIAIMKTKLIAVGPTSQFLTSLWGRRTVLELNQVDNRLLGALKAIGYEDIIVDNSRISVAVGSPAEDNPKIIEAVVLAGGRVLFVTELLPSLEEVYLKLVKN